MKRLLILLIIALSSCKGNRKDIGSLDSFPAISPDYVNVTIPPNIAPLNFMMKDAEKISVVIDGKKGRIMSGRWGTRLLFRPGNGELC